MKIVIPGTFPSLNEFIDANRTRRGNWSAGNQMKQESQERIIWFVCFQSRKKLTPPVFIRYHFFEPNRRRDLDNISGFFHKIFQDALVEAGLLKNDNWKYISGMSDEYDVDPENPRVEVEIIEA